MPVKCTTATILRSIEQGGWKVAPCPHIQWLDEMGYHTIVTFHSEYGYSGFEVKYDPEERDFTYFRALHPLSREYRIGG